MKAAIVGSGAWGTALAMGLRKNGHDVVIWTFEKELIEQIRTTRENPRLPGRIPVCPVFVCPRALRSAAIMLA